MDPKDQRAGAAARIRSQFGGNDALFGLTRNLPKLVELRLEAIQLNPDQPRKTFDEASLAELAASVERHGLIQPITVRRRREGDGYIIVAGERRFRAVQRLGRETIPAIVTTGSADEIALIENLQREDLRPLEEAEALARLMEAHGYSQEEVGKVLGKARNTINEVLRLTTLPLEIKEESRTSDSISKSTLLEIARVRDPEEQRRLWERVRSGTKTVRATRKSKDERRVKGEPAATAQLLATGRSFMRRLSQLPQQDIQASREQYQELLSLKATLDEFIAKLEESGR